MTAKKRIKKKATAKPKEKKRKSDWEHNQELISGVFYKILTLEQKMPTQKELAINTGLSEKTIERHLATSKFDRLIKRMRGLTDKAVITFAGKVFASEDHKMWKLYFELTEGFVEKKAVDVTSKGKQIHQVTGFVIADEKETT